MNTAPASPVTTTPAQQDEFDTAFYAEDAAKVEADHRARAQARLSALGQSLMTEFNEAEQARRLFEERWLDDLMQYRGQYAADAKPVVRRWIEREAGAIGAGGKQKILNSGKMVGSYEDWWKTLPEANRP